MVPGYVTTKVLIVLLSSISAKLPRHLPDLIGENEAFAMDSVPISKGA